MKRKIECVEEFHRIYKLGNSDKPIGKWTGKIEIWLNEGRKRWIFGSG